MYLKCKPPYCRIPPNHSDRIVDPEDHTILTYNVSSLISLALSLLLLFPDNDYSNTKGTLFM